MTPLAESGNSISVKGWVLKKSKLEDDLMRRKLGIRFR
jgi:hypothetical protein